MRLHLLTVTRTVAARALQSSLWPDFLRTDSALSNGVRRDVRYLVKLIELMKIFITVAGIVTPLGLYTALGSGKAITPAFNYAPDNSPFGLATPPRGNGTFGRQCERSNRLNYIPMPCPYTNDVVLVNNTHWILPYNLTYDIPQKVIDIYSSGTKGWPNTIANFFDIEYRQYTTGLSTYYNNGSLLTMGNFRQMQSLVLEEKVVLVEGLVVDTIGGGVGFRNHTIPSVEGRAGSWEEDLLFLQPETACVNTNLSLAFTMPIRNNTGDNVADLRLVDDGGFGGLNLTYPYYDHDNAQTNPDLVGRAYKAAWLNNVYMAAYLNVTNPANESTNTRAFQYLNSKQGKEFPLKASSTTTFDSLGLSGKFGVMLSGTMETSTTQANPLYPNPFNIGSANFSTIEIICHGVGKTDIANISNIMVGCGLMRGAAYRTDGGFPTSFEAGGTWKVPFYSCASTIRSTIKTASFLLNGTSGLSSVTVTELKQKQYPSNESLPLWGIEDTGLAINGFAPIWGLVSPEYASYPNISVVKKESLYLPGISFDAKLTRLERQNLPGSDFPRKALLSTYSTDTTVAGISVIDYTAASNMPMYNKWQNLSRTPATASNIINLIWTDFAASAVVGTKSALGRRGELDPVRIVVQPLLTQIKYRWLFGIPAVLVLLLCVLIAVFATITFVFHRHNLDALRRHLHQTSTGRIFTSFLSPEHSDLGTPTKVWYQNVGTNVIDLSGENPLMNALLRNNFYQGNVPVAFVDPVAGSDSDQVEKHTSGYERQEQVYVPLERQIPERVPSPYHGGGGLQEQSYPLTGELQQQHQQPHIYRA